MQRHNAVECSANCTKSTAGHASARWALQWLEHVLKSACKRLRFPRCTQPESWL
jgi:hypothetical protein